METIILCIIFGVFILISYTLGLRNGQKISKNEEINIPNINPVTVLTNEIEKHNEKKRQELNEILNYNIDNYDGTGLGQKELPDRM